MRTALRIAWLHPATQLAATAAFVVGAIGGTVPTGLLASASGAGLGRGASCGLWLYAAAAPAVVVYVAVAVAAARYQERIDQDLFLAGQDHARTLGRDALAVASIAVGLAAVAAAGGAVAGAADAVARTTALITPVSVKALVAGAGMACWLSVLAVLVVAAVRSALLSYAALLGVLVAGVAGVYLTASQAAWDALSASPMGPLALIGSPIVSGRVGLVTHVPLVLSCSALWMAAGAAGVRVGRRRALPRAR